MSLANKTAIKLNLPFEKVSKTIELLENDYSLPFIARYRKEITGNLNEDEIRKIRDEFQRLNNLEKRRQVIIQSINAQGKLTQSLSKQILNASTLTILEDLYLPYRPKRRSKATMAKEKGLEPLAHKIISQPVDILGLDEYLGSFLTNAVPDIESALSGASDIIAEMISENAAIRQCVRENTLNHGKLLSEKKEGVIDSRRLYETYYQFQVPLKLLKPHQILAIRRGENNGFLKVSMLIETRIWLTPILTEYLPNRKSVFYDVLSNAILDSARRLLIPSIEREIHRKLYQDAEGHAIKVFAQNIRALLTQAPLPGHVVLGIDPGLRTGSKVAVIGTTGKLLDSTTIYPHPPHNKLIEAKNAIESMIKKYQVSLIAIGNGTASRETELFIAEFMKNTPSLSYMIISEAGASVYSASKLAREEFPDLDVSIRGAVSIARRVQDPLAELVKIDPKSIGVGLYQHDLNQTILSTTLDQVVESVVNTVGVDANTASAPLLNHVAGIGPSLAEKIVQFREENGAFKNREELKNVPGMGPKSYEQSAGFLRIQGGDNPLDATSIHPEIYPIAMKLYDLLNIPANATASAREDLVNHFIEQTDRSKLTRILETGLITINDILAEIAQPGRDPRDEIPKPLLRKDILTMEDLIPGLQLKGTIRNVVDFGAFIDIGVKTDGLLHRSNISKGKNLKVGETITVTVLTVDHQRNRIALDMKEHSNDN